MIKVRMAKMKEQSMIRIKRWHLRSLRLCIDVGFGWTSMVAQTVKNLPKMWGTWVQFLSWADAVEKGMVTHSSNLGNPHGQRSLEGYSPWVCKKSDMTEWLTHTHTGFGWQRWWGIQVGKVNYIKARKFVRSRKFMRLSSCNLEIWEIKLRDRYHLPRR